MEPQTITGNELTIILGAREQADTYADHRSGKNPLWQGGEGIPRLHFSHVTNLHSSYKENTRPVLQKFSENEQVNKILTYCDSKFSF